MVPPASKVKFLPPFVKCNTPGESSKNVRPVMSVIRNCFPLVGTNFAVIRQEGSKGK